MKPQIGRLYVILDADLVGDRDWKEIVEQILDGGAETLQLRAKKWSVRRMLEAGEKIRDQCRERGVPFLINDRADVAWALEADGVHLGQEDFPLSHARRLLGEERVIGISVDTLEEALAAERLGADYVSLGPIFPTTTKTDAGPVVGLEGLARVRRGIRIPLVAVGGITVDKAGEVLAAGADAVAVAGAVLKAADVRAATAALRAALQGGEKDDAVGEG